ncbi:cupin, partial [Streptomyces sp. NPDC002491]
PPAALAEFHRAAAALVRPRLAVWRERRLRGAQTTAEQLDRLADGDVSYLAEAVVRAEEPSAHGRFGMCGRLDVYRA